MYITYLINNQVYTEQLLKDFFSLVVKSTKLQIFVLEKINQNNEY